MRAGLSTIQQTLTSEAATILTQSISEAGRRNHGQTTPLHVAATLLSSPNGLLRQACIRSHPNSSHPLQCRALELCFSVALDRLPSNSNTNTNSNNPDNNSPESPPISNALMAALKRAQAHQRRGCPEQQQSPLLAVKVELEQLVVSILDDPSVSRVMREASFSSPAVKATIEQSLTPTTTTTTTTTTCSSSSPNNPNRNLYMNPRLQRVASDSNNSGGRQDEKKVVEILVRSKKRNPVLVGDSDLKSVLKDVLDKIGSFEYTPPQLKSAKVISLEKELVSVGADRSKIPVRIRELGGMIESMVRLATVIVDLGDLKWLVESTGQVQQQKAVSEIGRAAVVEMGRIIGRFDEVRVVGTATCATYLRCQVYHPTMESEWDLQAVPIAPRSPISGLFPRLGSNGILSSSVEALAPSKGFPPIKPTIIPLRRPPEITNTGDTSQRQSLCSQCMENYERELSKLVAKEFEKSSSNSKPEGQPALPNWLQMAMPVGDKPSPDQFQAKGNELNWKQNVEGLLKKWRQTCSRLHPNSFTPRSFHPKLSLSQSSTPLQMTNSLDRPSSPPGSPVKTELVLGQSKVSSLEKTHRERIRDFPGCNQDNFSIQRKDKITTFQDSDSLKRLYKGLMEKVSWQPEAASAVTTAVINSKSGNGRRRGISPKADTWLLFIGHDKVGKRKMAEALSELVFGAGPMTVCFGCPRTDSNDGESEFNFRGKTSLDRIAEVIRQNPFSVIVLEDIDRADAIVRGTIKRAIERGRLTDSHGREVGLGSTIFILTANWLPDDPKNSGNSLEDKILNSANTSWQLELSIGGKRRPDWLSNNNKSHPAKQRKESSGLGLSLDLNLAAGGGTEDETGESSWNSSDLTVDHEHEHSRLAIKQSSSVSSSASELIDMVDESVVFKPVDLGPLRRRISELISVKFASMTSGRQSIRVDDDALDRMVGGVWISGIGFEDWAERVLVPGIERLKGSLTVDDGTAVQLSLAEVGGRLQSSGITGDWLPSAVRVKGGAIGGI